MAALLLLFNIMKDLQRHQVALVKTEGVLNFQRQRRVHPAPTLQDGNQCLWVFSERLRKLSFLNSATFQLPLHYEAGMNTFYYRNVRLHFLKVNNFVYRFEVRGAV